MFLRHGNPLFRKILVFIHIFNKCILTSTNNIGLSHIVNLSREDKIALHDLCTKNNVTFKPSEKGGTNAIWDSASCLREAHRQHNDRHYYIHLYHNPMSDLIFEISTFVTLLHQHHIVVVQCLVRV